MDGLFGSKDLPFPDERPEYTRKGAPAPRMGSGLAVVVSNRAIASYHAHQIPVHASNDLRTKVVIDHLRPAMLQHLDHNIRLRLQGRERVCIKALVNLA